MKPNSAKRRKGRFHGIHNHPYVLPVVTFLLLFFVSIFGYISLNGRTVGASDTMIVSLNVDGKEQILPTRAQTVRDLLSRLNITLSEHDIIEPELDTAIETDNFAVNIYRARTVLIEDGATKKVTYTAQAVPEAIVLDAGLEVYPEDRVLTTAAGTESTEDFLKDGIIAERVVVERAKLVHLNLYGTSVPVRTHAETVGELLAEKSVKLTGGDTLQPEANAPLAANSSVFVVRMGSQIASEEQTIPAPVETIEDPTLPAGTTKVQQPGSDGKKVITYEIELRNEAEASRKVIQEIIASAPVKRVVIKGTKVLYSNPSANVELGRRIAADMGWSHQFSCIYSIFDRESKWNHLARNRSSGAYGIPQALPGSKMGPGWESDPAVQIRWGIGYMVNRYGSPCQAQAFWNVNRWY